MQEMGTRYGIASNKFIIALNSSEFDSFFFFAVIKSKQLGGFVL